MIATACPIDILACRCGGKKNRLNWLTGSKSNSLNASDLDALRKALARIAGRWLRRYLRIRERQAEACFDRGDVRALIGVTWERCCVLRLRFKSRMGFGSRHCGGACGLDWRTKTFAPMNSDDRAPGKGAGLCVANALSMMPARTREADAADREIQTYCWRFTLVASACLNGHCMLME